MKKNLKVLQINGFRGLLLAFFIISCLIAGFIAFPAFLTMNIWNYFAVQAGTLLTINIGEGILLWAIITFSIFIFSKKKFIVSFNSQQELTEDEVKEVLSKIKKQTLNPHMLIPKDFNKTSDNKEETEVHTDSKNN